QAIADLIGQDRTRQVGVPTARLGVTRSGAIHDLERGRAPDVPGDERLLDPVPGRITCPRCRTEDAAQSCSEARRPCSQAEGAQASRRSRRAWHRRREEHLAWIRGWPRVATALAPVEHQALASTGRSAKRRETTRDTAASVMVTP